MPTFFSTIHIGRSPRALLDNLVKAIALLVYASSVSVAALFLGSDADFSSAAGGSP